MPFSPPFPVFAFSSFLCCNWHDHLHLKRDVLAGQLNFYLFFFFNFLFLKLSPPTQCLKIFSFSKRNQLPPFVCITIHFEIIFYNIKVSFYLLSFVFFAHHLFILLKWKKKKPIHTLRLAVKWSCPTAKLFSHTFRVNMIKMPIFSLALHHLTDKIFSFIGHTFFFFLLIWRRRKKFFFSTFHCHKATLLMPLIFYLTPPRKLLTLIVKTQEMIIASMHTNVP